MIPENIINQILDRCDISEIVGGYIPLKKSGRNFKANCPFHHEKTPSFMVSPDKGIFHCFGCGVGGNVISFMMKYERLEFPEVIRILAQKTGITLPHRNINSEGESSLTGRLQSIHDSAAVYFQNILNGPSGRHALRYLEDRGLKRETLAKFKIGYALDSWDGLLVEMRKKGVTETLLEKSGLILPREDKSGYYDRFRDRIMFPIFDARGGIVAFAGRVLGDRLPKYVNSPETHLYNKSRNLYGLNFSKFQIRKLNYAVIVEGYFDMMIPYQNDITNVIATCGTALTTDHIRQLKRHSKNVIMVYDSDNAGEMATLRNLDPLVSEELNVRVAMMPEGADPDSFVRKYGAEAFWEILRKSKGLFEYKLEILRGRHRSGTLEVRAKIADDMLQTIARVGSAVLRSGYVKKLAEELGLDEESLRVELKKVNQSGGERVAPKPDGVSKSVPEFRPVDKILIGLMLEDNSIIPKVKEAVPVDDFPEGVTRRIVAEIFMAEADGRKVTAAHLIQHMSQDGSEAEALSSIAVLHESVEDRGRNLEDCINWIKAERVKRRLDELRAQIKNAQKSNDEGKLEELMSAYNSLVKR